MILLHYQTVVSTQRLTLPIDELAERKTDLGAKEIANVLEWIERFNSEYNLVDSQKLTPQICGSHMFSLLHAAIIFEKFDLVLKLLQLGADPSAKSEQGSAVVFARRLAERAREKLQKDLAREHHLKDSGIDEGKTQEILGSTVPQRREEQISRLEDISRLLQQHAKSALHLRSPNETIASNSLVEGSTSNVIPGTLDSIKAGSQIVISSRPKPAAPKNCSYTAQDQAGPQLQLPTAGHAPNPLMNHHHLILAFCSTLESNDWVLENLAAAQFYKKIGGRDKESLAIARDASLDEGVVEFGREKLGQSNAVFRCDLHLDSGFKHHRYIRLTPKGKSLLQTQHSRKAQQPVPAGDRKRKANSDTDFAQPATKPHANSVAVSGHSTLQSTQLQRPLPASAQKRPVSSVPLEATGDVDLSPAEARHLLLLLESTWNPEETWAENGPISLVFYEKLHTHDKGAFKCGRRFATAKGFIKWGRRDLTASGEPVIATDTLRGRTGLSFETYLCLTPSGLAFLMSKGFDPAREARARQALSFAHESVPIKAAIQRASEINEPRRAVPPAHSPRAMLIHEQNPAIDTTAARLLAPHRGTVITTATAATVNDAALLPNVQDGRFWFEKNSSWPKPCAENFQRCPCRRPHLHPPLAEKLEMNVVRKKIVVAMYMEMDLPHGARVSADLDGSGLSVFTSAFFDPELNMYFLPEGGAGGRQNRQGVFWYPTKLMAKKALEKVWAVAIELKRQQQQQPQQHRPLAHGSFLGQDPGGYNIHQQGHRNHQTDNIHGGGNYRNNQYDNRNRHDTNYHENNRRHGHYW